jgi:hypothetical protein
MLKYTAYFHVLYDLYYENDAKRGPSSEANGRSTGQ